MDTAPLTKPQAVFSPRSAQGHDDHDSATSSPMTPATEFDPCCNAKVTSPFYLYKHDSPRPSYDASLQPPPAIHVTIKDLESGLNLTPTVTQEKHIAQRQQKKKFGFWSRKQQRCMTKPKPRSWLAQLPPYQRLLFKIFIALILIGAIVGIAVGISIKVHGGFYKNNSNQIQQIGT